MKAQLSALALTLPALATGCSSTSPERPPEPVAVQSASPTDFSGFATIADTVGGAPEFSTFARAFVAAGMAEKLASEGPYTVFVVRDEAAASLPVEAFRSGDWVALDRLAAYHVVAGRHEVADLKKVSSLETIGGQRLVFSHWNGVVEVAGFGNGDHGVGQARIVAGDQQCSNGVVHVVNQVLFPTFESLADQVAETESFTTLVEAARLAGVFDLLEQDGPFTVFAPTDEAFANFAPAAVGYLLAEEHRGELVRLLQHHVVEGRFYADNMHHQPLTTLAGTQFEVEWQSGSAYIGAVEVTGTDFEATNGVLHVVDAVLMPR